MEIEENTDWVKNGPLHSKAQGNEAILFEFTKGDRVTTPKEPPDGKGKT